MNPERTAALEGISKSSTSWFVRGAFAGLLAAAALNAAWYFVRSDGWGNLLGRTPERREALGFPVELWESGNTYGGYFVDYRALAIDMICGAGMGLIGGLITLSQRRRLNQLIDHFEATLGPSSKNFQVSLRGLLLATTIASILFAVAARFMTYRAEVLGGIYLLGPWLLIAIAFVPQRIPWEQRAAILIPSALLLMGGAVFVGSTALTLPGDISEPGETDSVYEAAPAGEAPEATSCIAGLKAAWAAAACSES